MRMFKVQSFSNPEKEYTVRFIEGDYYCNCPDFLVRGKQKGNCKHIIKVLNDESMGIVEDKKLEATSRPYEQFVFLGIHIICDTETPLGCKKKDGVNYHVNPQDYETLKNTNKSNLLYAITQLKNIYGKN